MNCRTKAMTISLLLHGAALSLVFALSSSLAKQNIPIVIDFTLVEQSAPAAPPAKAPQKKAESPIIAKPTPQPKPVKEKVTSPAPAVEAEGPVPIVAKPREPAPLPPAQTGPVTATNNASGGTVPTGTSRTAGYSAGGTAEQLSNRYRSENFAYIKKIIEENLSYPPRAQRMGWMGKVVVSFDVSKNGNVQEIRIVRSSGHEILDSNLVETIRKVEPFPRPPISVTLNMPITYELR